MVSAVTANHVSGYGYILNPICASGVEGFTLEPLLTVSNFQTKQNSTRLRAVANYAFANKLRSDWKPTRVSPKLARKLKGFANSLTARSVSLL